MTTQELIRHKDRVLAAVGKARDLGHDAELLGHWGRYSCVLCAGFLENALRILYAEHARAKFSKDVARYVESSLRRFQNPKGFRFVEVATSFDTILGESLKSYLDEDDGKRRNAIDSIMNHRNLIAHGKESTISVAAVQSYLSVSLEVVDFIQKQCASTQGRSN